MTQEEKVHLFSAAVGAFLVGLEEAESLPTITKEQFLADVGALFDADCQHTGAGDFFSIICSYAAPRTFTYAERETFLNHLWDKFNERN